MFGAFHFIYKWLLVEEGIEKILLHLFLKRLFFYFNCDLEKIFFFNRN